MYTQILSVVVLRLFVFNVDRVRREFLLMGVAISVASIIPCVLVDQPLIVVVVDLIIRTVY